MYITKTQLRSIIKEEIGLIFEVKWKVGDEVEHDTDNLGRGKVIAVEPGKKGNVLVKWSSGAKMHHRWALRSLQEGKKASKTVGDPPYRERGATESQAQQKAAGMALSARRGDTPANKLKGAALELYHNDITTKELRNLAKLGQKVKQHKTKEPKHLKSLPGHATPAKD